MIKFANNNGGELRLVQQDVPPTVYLDHWALRKLSENSTLTARFSEALKARNGTLALSWLNLVEFANVKKGNHARTAETLVERLLPQVFFIEVDPFIVIKRENELLGGGSPAPPHADLDLLGVFAELKPTSLNFFTSRDLFAMVRDSGFGGRFADFAKAMTRSLVALQGGFVGSSQSRSGRQPLSSDRRIQRGTRGVLSELVRAHLANKQTKHNPNHAIDLIHAVVPVAYCDYVLLDKHWRALVDRVRARFRNVGLSQAIARVFSEGSNGVEQFLCELKSGSHQP